MAKRNPKNFECPICQSSSNGCKDNRENYGGLVTCRIGGSTHVNGYSFAGFASGALAGWSLYYPSSKRASSTAVDPEEFAKRKERQQRLLAAEGKITQFPTQRDLGFRSVMRENLSREAITDLLGRGLSQEAIVRMVRDGIVWNWNEATPPEDLPWAKNIAAPKYAQYMVSAIDSEGRVLGAQARWDVSPKVGEDKSDRPKYTWLSSEERGFKIGGEMPITVAKPGRLIKQNWGKVGVTEGLLKPQIAAEMHGMPFLGAPGYVFTSSRKQIKRVLKRLAESWSNLQIVFFPDADCYNPRKTNILAAHYTNAQLFSELAEELGLPQPQVAYWGQHSADAGDCDEITADTHITNISLEEFLKPLAPVKYYAIAPAFNRDRGEVETLKVDEWAIVGSVDKFVANLEKNEIHFTSDNEEGAIAVRSSQVPSVLESLKTRKHRNIKLVTTTCSQIVGQFLSTAIRSTVIETKDGFIGQEWKCLKAEKPVMTHPVSASDLVQGRYLPQMRVPAHIKLVVNISEMGRGKTTALAEALETDARLANRAILSVTPRQTLTIAQSAMMQTGSRYLSGHENQRINQKNGGKRKVSVCFEQFQHGSSMEVEPDEFKQAVVILDEFVTGMAHLMGASTIDKSRVTISQRFEQIIKTASVVVAMDANMTTNEVELLQNVMGINDDEIMVVGVENDKFTGRHYTQYDTKNEILHKLTEDAIAFAANGEKVMIVADSREVTSKNSTGCTEAIAMTLESKGLRVLRIDRFTLAIKDSAACAALEVGLNDAIKDYDAIVASPSIESGVSLKEGHNFSAVYGLFHGVVSLNAATQMLERVRDNCPRHIWAAPTAKNAFIGGRTAEQIQRQNDAEDLKKGDIAYEIGGEFLAYDQLAAFEEKAPALFVEWANRHEETDKAAGRMYATNLAYILNTRGYRKLDAIAGCELDRENFIENLKEACAERLKQNLAKLIEAEAISCQDERMTEAQYWGNEKYSMLKWINCGQDYKLTEEVARLARSASLRSKADLNFAVVGSTIAREVEKVSVLKQLSAQTVVVNGLTRNNKTTFRSLRVIEHKVRLLEKIEIIKGIDAIAHLSEFANDSEEIATFNERIVANAEELAETFKITIHREEGGALRNVKKILNLVGYNNEAVRRENTRNTDGTLGKRTYYKISCNETINGLTQDRMAYLSSEIGTEELAKARKAIEERIEHLAGYEKAA
jgi:hypothetical protein